MGTTNSRTVEPKVDKESTKRKVFTAGFEVMGAEATVQVGYRSHTLKRYAATSADPTDKDDDDLYRVPERPTGTALPSVGPDGSGGDSPTSTPTSPTQG